jgi:hypothetical protein
MTGYNPGFQPQNSAFHQIANMPQQQPQQPQQPAPDKFAPSNIFAAMKKNDFGKPEEQQPQGSGKYDALRPLATGMFNSPSFGQLIAADFQGTMVDLVCSLSRLVYNPSRLAMG